MLLKKKKVPKCITDDIDISFDDSNEENSDEETSAEEKSNEEN